MHVAVLAGGVGAARFLDGLVQVAKPSKTTAIVNVGDDFELLGLHISPDIDTIHYTLAGLVHREQGWGRAEETTNALATVCELGGEDWFLLGDRDIGLHLVRTERLRAGRSLSDVTDEIGQKLGVPIATLPATNDRLRTMLGTPAGELDFQTYFVRRRHEDPVSSVRYDGAANASAGPGVVAAIDEADVVVIAPSNPFLSIGPILAISDIAAALASRKGPTVAISPIIGGKAVKGPADRLLRTFAGEASVVALGRHYGDLLTHLLIDEADADAATELKTMGLTVGVSDTLMTDGLARARVARAAVELAADR